MPGSGDDDDFWDGYDFEREIDAQNEFLKQQQHPEPDEPLEERCSTCKKKKKTWNWTERESSWFF